MKKSGFCTCIVVCNPINHVAEKTLGNPTSNGLRVKNIHENIWFVYIFCIGSFLLIYYTNWHFLYIYMYTGIVSNICGQYLQLWWSSETVVHQGSRSFSLLGKVTQNIQMKITFLPNPGRNYYLDYTTVEYSPENEDW